MTGLTPSTISPLLTAFAEGGVLAAGDVHVAQRLARICGEHNDTVVLASALAIRALRAGSVCIHPGSVAEMRFGVDENAVDVAQLPWPEPTGWLDALRRSPLVTLGPDQRGITPLRLVAEHLYVERYWRHQESVANHIRARREHEVTLADVEQARRILEHYFPGDELEPGEIDYQRQAAVTALTSTLTVIAGGPGTGKTTTVGKTLSALLGVAPNTRIALAAPTGKAAVRLEESIRDQLDRVSDPGTRHRLATLTGSTVHRLLAWGRDRSRPDRFHAHNPLPYDVVVVDEVSMVSLPMMAGLLDALAPETALILVGDPDQLASVEAGAVLADIVAATVAPQRHRLELMRRLAPTITSEQPTPAEVTSSRLGSDIVELRRNWRFGSAITTLAYAIKAGDVTAAMSAFAADDTVAFVETDMSATHPIGIEPLRDLVVATARQVATAAHDNDPAQALRLLDQHRLMCAHRTGPCGVARWEHTVQGWLHQHQLSLTDHAIGLPIMITENFPELDLFNGDVGVIINTEAGPKVAFARRDSHRLFSPAQLATAVPLHAMTVHKSQGSQFAHVSMILPPEGSPLLTRELLYTAITRAQTSVTVYGSPAALTTAITTRALRASGLQARLSS